jgi:hypothetical protein
MSNIENARDIGQGIYTQSEIDTSINNIPQPPIKVASNVLLSGNLALASSAITKSNANITYTGNGSTQSITTGIGSVDFTVASNGSGYYHDRSAGDCIVKNDAGTIVESGSCVVNVSKVHIKCRSTAYGNNIYDGIRGIQEVVFTNETAAEANSIGTLTAFGSGSISVGSGVGVNQSGQTYILHQALYTHIKWGLTNQGKRYITAYNPVTREVMTMYQGSGIAGHQIPNALGIKLDYVDIKQLDLSADGWVSINGNINRGQINTTGAFITSTANPHIISDNYLEIGSSNNMWNGVNQPYISYGFANSETKIITQYQGTRASGNFVETKDVNGVPRRPRRVIIKRIDSTGSWYAIDSERGATNQISLDSSSAELGFTGEINIDGFTVGGINTGYNASGGQYIAIVEFDTTNSTDDTYFDLPTDDTNLNVTAGKLPYTDGRDTTNGAYNVFTQSYTGSVDFSTCPDGIHYVALDSNNAPKFYDALPIFNTVTGVMYDNDGTTALTTPISFIDDKPYQVASGTPMDRLEDYPSIPKNVMESSYVDGDLEVSGEVKGKNQCTAWVNFDGTTTPPTIRDSFNVRDVVRIGTGQYDIYFKEEMGNTNYSVSGTAENYGVGYGAYIVGGAPTGTRNAGQELNHMTIGTAYYGSVVNCIASVHFFGGK